ncbi:MAG: class I SAM-dependent methyltransferase [Clostridia bacterium]
MIVLDKRLKEIAFATGKGSVMADIGSDHGFLSLFLLQNKQAEKIYVCDISEKSLEKAQKLFSSCNEQAIFVISDGFKQLSCKKIDVAIIAGMGGIEIGKIVTNIPKEMHVEKIVCQPMRNVLELKHRMIELGYKICEDTYAQDKQRFYEIITFKKGANCLSELEIEFGKENIEILPQSFVEFLKKEEKRFKKVASGSEFARIKIEKIREILRRKNE